MKKYSKPQKRNYEKVKTDVRKPRQVVGKKGRKSDRIYRNPGILYIPRFPTTHF